MHAFLVDFMSFYMCAKRCYTRSHKAKKSSRFKFGWAIFIV